jgi:DNA (cytosine-5)-methyltransferase 1
MDSLLKFLQNEWRRLQTKDQDSVADDDVIFELSDFCVYAPERKTSVSKNRKPDLWDRFVGSFEMLPLHLLRANMQTYPLLFDGVLSCGDVSYYIQEVPFERLSIGGYNDMDKHSVCDIVWIQSQHCQKDASLLSSNRPWYRIQQPRSEYLRYHEPFLWIADLGKHFVDYLQDNTDTKTYVHFSHFEAEFHAWLISHHGQSIQFQQWLRAFGQTDFRVAIAANVEHLWTEATNINDKLRRHFVWKEMDPKALNAIPPQMSVCAKPAKTVVTPFVYECFKNIYFASMIEARVATDPIVKASQRSRKKALGFMNEGYIPALLNMPPPKIQSAPTSINPGDVVGVSRDVESAWKKTKAEIWFGN